MTHQKVMHAQWDTDSTPVHMLAIERTSEMHVPTAEELGVEEDKEVRFYEVLAPYFLKVSAMPATADAPSQSVYVNQVALVVLPGYPACQGSMQACLDIEPGQVTTGDLDLQKWDAAEGLLYVCRKLLSQPYVSPVYAMLLYQWLLVNKDAGGAEQRQKHVNLLVAGACR